MNSLTKSTRKKEMKERGRWSEGRRIIFVLFFLNVTAPPNTDVIMTAFIIEERRTLSTRIYIYITKE
jgi:hypothetical protein